MKRIRATSRIAVAVGSRGIHAIDRITLAVVEELKRLGAIPLHRPLHGKPRRGHGGRTEKGPGRFRDHRRDHGRARRLFHGDRAGRRARRRNPRLPGQRGDCAATGSWSSTASSRTRPSWATTRAGFSRWSPSASASTGGPRSFTPAEWTASVSCFRSWAGWSSRRPRFSSAWRSSKTPATGRLASRSSGTRT